MRKVALIIQKEQNVPKEELLEFEGLVTEILPRRPLPRSARQRTSARCLHRRKNEKESDQNPGRGSRDGRSITLRFGKGAIDLPPQGRTRRIAEPSAAASPVSAAMTGSPSNPLQSTPRRRCVWTARVSGGMAHQVERDLVRPPLR